MGRRRAKKTEEGDKYHMWGRRRTGLNDNFNWTVSLQFLIAADRHGVSVEWKWRGSVPTSDWMLNLQILTSGGYQCAPASPHHQIRGNVGNPSYV